MAASPQQPADQGAAASSCQPPGTAVIAAPRQARAASSWRRWRRVFSPTAAAASPPGAEAGQSGGRRRGTAAGCPAPHRAAAATAPARRAPGVAGGAIRTGANSAPGPSPREGLGGVPQVEAGVELPPQALDIEHGLLQQHQRRLDVHVEAPGGAKQVDQQLAEGDLPMGRSEYQFAGPPAWPTQILHPGLGPPSRIPRAAGPPRGNRDENAPAGCGPVVLVRVAEAADDRRSRRRCRWVCRVASIDKNIARCMSA